MTMFDFQLLSESEKIEALYQRGVYIAKRRVDESVILLYQLEGFYIEIFYRKYRIHIKHIHCFSSTSLLDPYLEQIDVENLV